MKDVKPEIFGTRPKTLSEFFRRNRIDFIENFWLVTCRQSINCDPLTRYIVFFESLNESLNLDLLSVEWFKEQLRDRVYVIHFDKGGLSARITNVISGTNNIFTIGELKLWIIELTKCKEVKSSAISTSAATPLSKFFRERMGSGFALTDIDYLLPRERGRSLFIEEKTIISEEKNRGYLGHGQAISFTELSSEILNQLDSLYVVSVKEGRIYLNDFKSIDIARTRFLSRWGKMVEFELGKKFTEREFLEFLKSFAASRPVMAGKRIDP